MTVHIPAWFVVPGRRHWNMVDDRPYIGDLLFRADVPGIWSMTVHKPVIHRSGPVLLEYGL